MKTGIGIAAMVRRASEPPRKGTVRYALFCDGYCLREGKELGRLKKYRDRLDAEGRKGLKLALKIIWGPEPRMKSEWLFENDLRSGVLG